MRNTGLSHAGQKRVMQLRMWSGSQLIAKRKRTRASDLANLSSLPKYRLGSVWLAVTYREKTQAISTDILHRSSQFTTKLFHQYILFTCYMLMSTAPICPAPLSHLLVELLVDHVEYLSIDGQHEQQRRQHPAEEVEIDHIFHADDGLKLTGDQEIVSDHGAIVSETSKVIPSQHGCKAHYDRHQPAQQHSCAGPPRRHHPLVAMETEE